MSLAKDLEDYLYERDHDYFENYDVWTNQYGHRIRVKDMTYSHVESCMRLLPEECEWHHHFKEELAKRNKEIASILLVSHLEWLNYIIRRMSHHGKFCPR